MLIPRQDIFDTYWRFAASRQEIFFKRFNGEHARPCRRFPNLELGRGISFSKYFNKRVKWFVSVIYINRKPTIS